MALEVIAMRRLYGRDHLDHVLGTFGLILFFNELVRLIWGPAGMTLPLPALMLTADAGVPRRLSIRPIGWSIIAVALAVAFLLYVLVMRTRIGMLIRAGASNREMVGALGINIKLLYTLVFGIGAALAGLAGMMQAPILVRADRHGREHPDPGFRRHHHRRHRLDPRRLRRLDPGRPDRHRRPRLPARPGAAVPEHSAGSTAGPALSSMLIYMLMAVVLVVRPEGLFPAASK